MLLLLPYHTALLSFSRLVRTMLTKCGYDVGCVTHEMMTIVAGDRFVSVCTMCELSVCVCVCVCTMCVLCVCVRVCVCVCVCVYYV